MVFLTAGLFVSAWFAATVAWLRFCRARRAARAIRLAGIALLLAVALGGGSALGRRQFVDIPLVGAAARGDVLRVHTLLARGANVNTVHNSATALGSAVRQNHAEVVRLLLAHGADPNLSVGPNQPRPLTLARQLHHADIASQLEKVGGHN